MKYNYLLPIIHLGPIGGYQYNQSLPLNELSKNIIGGYAKIEIVRNIIFNNEILLSKKNTLKFQDGNWSNKKNALFKYKSKFRDKTFGYIETNINLIEGKGFLSHFFPSHYVNYTHTINKSYLSCGVYKYGDPRVIMQMENFTKWLDGYPAININKKSNLTYSLIIINPYVGNNKYFLEFKNPNCEKEIVVRSRSVKSINLFNYINKNNWTGQVYVSGNKKANLFLVHHSNSDPKDIITVEHSDPYRAELTYKPNFMIFRNSIHKFYKSLKRLSFIL